MNAIESFGETWKSAMKCGEVYCRLFKSHKAPPAPSNFGVLDIGFFYCRWGSGPSPPQVSNEHGLLFLNAYE